MAPLPVAYERLQTYRPTETSTNMNDRTAPDANRMRESDEKADLLDETAYLRAPLLETKETEHSDEEQQQPRSARPVLRDPIRRILPAFLIVLGLWSLVRAAFVQNHHWCPGKTLQSLENKVALVPLEAHIMSKCPDAKDCLEKLVVPSMVNISDKVSFTLSYIGSIDADSDDVHCMHGPGECLGNIIQLCAAKVYPDPKIYLGFTNCMTSDYKDIPERSLVEACALEHGVDFQTLNDCISEEGEGMDLLRASVERSRHQNVTKSCTVRLNGKMRCVRDGGEWYDCPGGSKVSDLVGDVQDLYDDLN